ncbi:MAG: hypothetical protein E7282_06320 [Lachnospiraceae bacterium]|nr:hypothetical protein [Lachnospiraceae bacterium]
MKTDHVPALVTLSAGAVYCVVGLSQDLNGFTFAKELLIVLVIFFVIGSIIKIVLDKSFKDFDDLENESEEGEVTEESEEKEDIDFSEKEDNQNEG